MTEHLSGLSEQQKRDLIEALVSGVLALEYSAWARDMLRTEAHKANVRAFIEAMVNGSK
jgi:hypothetical protein